MSQMLLHSKTGTMQLNMLWSSVFGLQCPKVKVGVHTLAHSSCSSRRCSDSSSGRSASVPPPKLHGEKRVHC